MKKRKRIKLYKIESKSIEGRINLPTKLKNYDLCIFKPTINKLYTHPSNFWLNIILFIVTFSKYRIIYLYDNGIVVHYTYLIPKIFRFQFMAKSDIQIGPCFTYDNYRGKGIYKTILSIIPQLFVNDYKNFWIYTAEDNFISQKAIEHTGFNFVGFVYRSRFLHKILPFNQKNEN